MNLIHMRINNWAINGMAYLEPDGRYVAAFSANECREGVWWPPAVERALETDFASEAEALAAIAVIASSTYG